MDARDREAIESLFARIEDVERQAGPREAEAERLIAERLQRQPAAPYYLAQTVVMQDLALKSLQARVEELEKAAKTPPETGDGGGFFARALGGAASLSSSRTSVPGVSSRGPWGEAKPQPAAYPPAPQAYAPPPYAPAPSQGYGAAQPAPGIGGGRMGGGGFLAGAASTAMGVAGGVVLGNALGSMFGGHGGLFGGHEGLFGGGGGATEVTENVTNIYEAPQQDVTDVADTGVSDAGGDDGYQDASYDDAGTDDGGYQDV